MTDPMPTIYNIIGWEENPMQLARSNPEPDDYERAEMELVEDARRDRIALLIDGEGEDG